MKSNYIKRTNAQRLRRRTFSRPGFPDIYLDFSDIDSKKFFRQILGKNNG